MIRLLICGSRSITDYSWAIQQLNKLVLPYKSQIECIISGMADGPDAFGAAFAISNDIKLLPFPAKWKVDGVFDPKAGFKRNQQMLDEGHPTHVLAMIDPASKTHGTDHMCSISNDAGIVVKKIFYN
jgi:hypothetical protein